ncbi:MAG: NAD(P)-dependent oxidoreductase [Polyangiaceae bacterium]|nr:NAD(P)-dependent oxidoreductase [Polyangiaceae bacterium]
MQILFTGASSFTGFWFVKAFAAAGHQVVATFRQPLDSYTGVRGERVRGLGSRCEPVIGCSFGEPAFLELVRSRSFDVLCHHAADVTNYKSPDFDFQSALTNNTLNLAPVLAALRERGCQRVVLTGSVFEAGEGAGSDGLPAFSPYGLSKGLTASAFEYYARFYGCRLGKFVIPNPFGPYEDPRFTAYLVRNWFAGTTPSVNTPAYVRDNIHVSLLAKAYVGFTQGLPGGAGMIRSNPSGYVGSQGSFALLLAGELERRLGLPCPVDLRIQTQFAEPLLRINTDPVNGEALGWDEAQAWDEMAEYYLRDRTKA